MMTASAAGHFRPRRANAGLFFLVVGVAAPGGAVGAVAAAADGLLDEDRTDREEHDNRYDQCQNDITNTHG